MCPGRKMQSSYVYDTPANIQRPQNLSESWIGMARTLRDRAPESAAPSSSPCEKSSLQLKPSRSAIASARVGGRRASWRRLLRAKKSYQRTAVSGDQLSRVRLPHAQGKRIRKGSRRRQRSMQLALQRLGAQCPLVDGPARRKRLQGRKAALCIAAARPLREFEARTVTCEESEHIWSHPLSQAVSVGHFRSPTTSSSSACWGGFPSRALRAPPQLCRGRHVVKTL